MKFVVSARTQADLDSLHQMIESEQPPANRIKARLVDWVQFFHTEQHPLCAAFDLVYTQQQAADQTWQRIKNKQAQIAAAALAFFGNYHQCTHGVDKEPINVTCTGETIRAGGF